MDAFKNAVESGDPTAIEAALADDVAGKVMSAFVRATKPAAAAKAARACGCADECCA